jgi:SAGA-associated factor 73
MSIKLRLASPPQPFSFAPTSPPSQHGASSSKTPTTGAGNATNPIEFILEKDQSMFGAYPLETERGKGLLKCRKCAKIVAEAAAGEHVRTLYLPCCFIYGRLPPIELGVADDHVGICNHVLNGAPLTNKKTVKKSETLKRRASEGMPSPSQPVYLDLVPKFRLSETDDPVSEENESPNKKRQKLPVLDDLSQLPPLPSFKGMKKSEIKRIKKERERLEKKALKLQAKNEAQERKRMRGESSPLEV